MTNHPPKSPWKRAASSAILAWLAVAALSFVCGLIIEAVDAFGRSEPTHFLVAGLLFGAIGALFFGIPLALLTGIMRWLADRKSRTAPSAHTPDALEAPKTATAIRDALATCIAAPPQDLISFYASPPLVAPKLHINILTLDEAIRYTRAVQECNYLGSSMGLFALDDANNSNPFCYVNSGPAKGCILHLYHDAEATIAYSSLEEFVAAIKTAIAEETFVDDLPGKNPRPALNQDQLCNRISELTTTDTDEATSELVFLTSLLDAGRIETVRTLAAHVDFYVREAVALLISQYPDASLLEVADGLADDPHPQVARPGKAALSAVQRMAKEP